MWADVIVILPPCLDEMTGMGERQEPVLVEAFIAELAVEAFGVAVLCWLARSDVVPFDMVMMCPLQDSPAGEFRAVIADDAMGLAVPGDKPVKLPYHSGSADGGVYGQQQAFTGTLIHDAQDTEPASV